MGVVPVQETQLAILNYSNINGKSMMR